VKKILALVLVALILMVGLVECKPEEPDPHEGLYGTYMMVGVEIKIGGKRFECYLDELPIRISSDGEDNEKINDFLSHQPPTSSGGLLLSPIRGLDCLLP